MNKKEFENLALDIYCTYFKLSKENFYNKDCPDIQSKDDSLGIEVTNVAEEKNEQLNDYFFKLRDNVNYSKNKGMLKSIQEGNLIVENSSVGVIYPLNDNFSQIINAIKTKTTKLNNNYKIFKKNSLFLIIKYQILDIDFIKKIILPEIDRANENFKIHFDEYLLYDFYKKDLFQIKNKSIKLYNMDNI